MVIVIAIALAVVSFVLRYHIERRFDGLQVFDQYNVLFQADPNERIFAISHGWGSSGRNLAHPNFSNFMSPPIRVVALVATRLGVTDRDEEDVRRSLGLVVVPAVSGLMSAALFLLFLYLGCSLVTSIMLALLGMVSFSSLVFGSIPDHLTASALVITAGYFLLLESQRSNRIRKWPWAITAFIAAGITITNLVSVAILLLTAMWRARYAWRRSLTIVAAAGAATVLVTYGSAFVMNAALHGRQIESERSVNWVRNFVSDNPAAQALQFPVAVANTFAPSGLSIGGPTASFQPDDRYQFRFTLDEMPPVSARMILSVITLALVTAGVVLTLRSRDSSGDTLHRYLLPAGMASIGILTWNWLLHAAWGDELFLYSQHWFVAALVLIAIATQLVTQRYRFAPLFLGAYVILVALNSLSLIREMFAVIIARGG